MTINETVSRQFGASEESAAGSSSAGTPWRFWGTTGFGALILGVYFVIQGLVAYIFALPLLAEQPDMAPEELASLLENNGQLWAVAICTTGVLCTLLILLLAGIRRGISIRNYLGLRVLPWRSAMAWLAIGILVVTTIDGIMLLAGQEVIPAVWINAYQSTTSLALLWIALIIAAPLFEEFMFRGFLFSGWLSTKLKATGTILLTSIIWTLMHVQYDLVHLLAIFVYGIVLGLARYRTRSLITPLVMHGAINLVALVQVTILFS